MTVLRKTIAIFIVLSLLTVFPSCLKTKPTETIQPSQDVAPEEFEPIPAEEILEAAPGESAKPPSLSEEPMEDYLPFADTTQADFHHSPKYTGNKISVEFHDVDIREILMDVAKTSGLNIVIDSSVQGNFSVRLKEVPWDQVLDVLLDANQLEKIKVGNVLRIGSKERIEKQKKEWFERSCRESLEPLSFKIIPVNFGDAKQIKEALDEIGILSPRGKVAVYEPLNYLLILDIPKAIEQFINTVRVLDSYSQLARNDVPLSAIADMGPLHFHEVNPFIDAEDERRSVTRVIKGSASYYHTRRELIAGVAPEARTVRTEEFVNSFQYSYKTPRKDEAFSMDLEAAPFPFSNSHINLLRIGVVRGDLPPKKPIKLDTPEYDYPEDAPTPVLPFASAKDIEIQPEVTFNPDVVRSYRLLGHEKLDDMDRWYSEALARLDRVRFDKGREFTTLYQFKLNDKSVKAGTWICKITINYKIPATDDKGRIERTFSLKDLTPSFKKTSPDFKLAAAVAEFAEILRGSYWAKDGDLGEVLRVIQSLDSDDPRVVELAYLVSRARQILKTPAKGKN